MAGCKKSLLFVYTVSSWFFFLVHSKRYSFSAIFPLFLNLSSNPSLFHFPNRLLQSPSDRPVRDVRNTQKGATQECKLLGKFGIWVQVVLGVLCLSTLVVKRYREEPRRRWSVFLLDASKQLTGGFTIHILNLVCASLLSGYHSSDPCDWYWINIVVDCTIGVFWLYFYLKLAKRFFNLTGPREFGFYGNPIRLSAWAIQMALWQGIVVLMKFTMVLVMLLAHHLLEAVASVVLSLLNYWPEAKLVMVMIITPVAMNTVQFWLVDNFIQSRSRPFRKAIGSPSSSRTLEPPSSSTPSPTPIGAEMVIVLGEESESDTLMK